MIACCQNSPLPPRRLALHAGLAALALCGLAVSLGGCAGVGDSFASVAFVDPAKYELFDCQQLEGERKALATRSAELQGLIDKAHTGAGGAVVGEMVYRNDYISARAQAKLAEQMWQRNKCVPGTGTTPAKPLGEPVDGRDKPSPGRIKGIY